MKTEFNNTRELIEAWPCLDDDVRAALLSAVSTRGKFKGYVLANSPAVGTGSKYISWQAIIGELAPVRTSVFGLLLAPADLIALYDRLEEALSGKFGLGLALRAQEPALRWSLFAHRYELEALRKTFYAAVLKYNQKGE